MISFFIKPKLEENFGSLLSGYIVSNAFMLFHSRKTNTEVNRGVFPAPEGHRGASSHQGPRGASGLLGDRTPAELWPWAVHPPLTPSFSPQMFPLPVANGKSRPTSLAGAQFGSSGRTPLAAWGLLVCLRRSPRVKGGPMEGEGGDRGVGLAAGRSLVDWALRGEVFGGSAQARQVEWG